MAAPHVFLIEEDGEQRRLLSLILTDASCLVSEAVSVTAALSDPRLPLADAIVFHSSSEDEARRFVDGLRSAGADTPCVMLSAWGKYAQPRADELGVAFLPKPFENEQLIRVVRQGVDATRRARIRRRRPAGARRSDTEEPKPREAGRGRCRARGHLLNKR